MCVWCSRGGRVQNHSSRSKALLSKVEARHTTPNYHQIDLPLDSHPGTVISTFVEMPDSQIEDILECCNEGLSVLRSGADLVNSSSLTLAPVMRVRLLVTPSLNADSAGSSCFHPSRERFDPQAITLRHSQECPGARSTQPFTPATHFRCMTHPCRQM